MNIERGHAPVNGTRLYYEIAGDGEPVVLLHGFTLDARMWDAQFGPFAERHRVLRYDLRGFGRSDLPDGTEYARTDDLRALLAHLGIARAHVVGLSMGGAAAIDFALAHPEMTRTLTTVDAALSGYRMSAQWETLRAHVVAAGDVAEIKARWLALPLFAPANEQPAVAARLAEMVTDYSGVHWVRSDRHRRASALDELERVRVPMLALLGERDLPDFHTIADLLATRAHARKIVIPGAGHMSPMEAPDAFNRAVLDFLAAHAD